MSLLEKFKNYIKQQDLFSEKDRLLIAVSGGVDSVVLTELCYRAGYNFSIAHCNFQLRGKDSDRDEEFVQGVAKKYGVPFFSKKFGTNTYAEQNRLSIQEAARELRYAWFKEVKGDATHLLTAHHADDNIETLLMNFFRGTGVRGLKGIEPKNGWIVRPLLFARRSEIEDFQKENKLSFVQDESNLRDDYTRNFFRNQLIPSITKAFPEAEKNLLRNIERFRDVHVLYNEHISQKLKKLAEKKGNEVHIPVLKLAKEPALDTIIFELVKDHGFTSKQVEEIRNLMQSETGKYVRSQTHRIIRNRKWLIISPLQTSEADNILIEEETGNLEFGIGKLSVETKDQVANVENNSSIATLDAGEIHFPLLLRKWKPGDYFYPLGMRKKKKLARFLIDQKLSKTEKEKVWVVEMDRKILWVIGHRIDDRFKVTPKTRRILQITRR